MASTLETRSILHMCKQQKDLYSVSFSNEARQIYVQEIITSIPEHLQLEVTAPEGRVSELDPMAHWTATLWNHRGAYQSKVQSLHRKGSLLVMTFHPKAHFLARRKSIRLAPDSRNPTRIQFLFREQWHQGVVVDYCLEGIGIVTQPLSGLGVGSTLNHGLFRTKGADVGFERARVVQHSWSQPKMRLGLVFEKLTEDQEKSLHSAYNQSFMPIHSASTALDG